MAKDIVFGLFLDLCLLYGLIIEVFLNRTVHCALVVGTLPMASLGFFVGSGLSRLSLWVTCPGRFAINRPLRG